MIQIDLKNRKPIYEQVVDNYKELIIKQVLKPDDRVPSVRELAKELTINPNTIQKAYKELENQGFVYMVQGQGCFIAAPPDKSLNEKRIGELKEIVKSGITELCYLKCPQAHIKQTIDEAMKIGIGGTSND